MQNVLITGIGLISLYLGNKLENRGYKVFYLTRDKKRYPNLSCFEWKYEEQYIEKGALKNIDHIIHLSGANIGKSRWTAARKKEIIDSRVLTSNLIYRTLKLQKTVIQSFVSASAVGYYGAISSSKTFQETDQASKDFLGKTCKDWENSSVQYEKLGIRTVILRTGIVLTKEDGALAKIVKPIKNGYGAVLGNGNQIVPWIHIEDLCRLYVKSLEDDQFKGVFNAVASEQISNKEMMITIAHHFKRNLVLPPIPILLLKLILGEMSSLVLYGSRISNDKLIAAKFKFRFEQFGPALESLIEK